MAIRQRYLRKKMKFLHYTFSRNLFLGFPDHMKTTLLASPHLTTGRVGGGGGGGLLPKIGSSHHCLPACTRNVNRN